MVANMPPLGCPLPRCRERMCLRHPSPAIKRAPLPPCVWLPAKENHAAEPPEGSLYSLSSRLTHIVLHRVHRVIIVTLGIGLPC